jgi:hypothetical protein
VAPPPAALLPAARDPTAPAPAPASLGPPLGPPATSATDSHAPPLLQRPPGVFGAAGNAVDDDDDGVGLGGSRSTLSTALGFHRGTSLFLEPLDSLGGPSLLHSLSQSLVTTPSNAWLLPPATERLPFLATPATPRPHPPPQPPPQPPPTADAAAALATTAAGPGLGAADEDGLWGLPPCLPSLPGLVTPGPLLGLLPGLLSPPGGTPGGAGGLRRGWGGWGSRAALLGSLASPGPAGGEGAEGGGSGGGGAACGAGGGAERSGLAALLAGFAGGSEGASSRA